MRRMTVGLALLCSLSIGINAANAQEAEQRTRLSGFGSWHYGLTSEPNEFLGGTPKGEFDNSSFGLNASSRLSEKGLIAAQFELHGSEAELDYAFASWRFSDAAILKAGTVKLPFGISTEVFDVGTLRPFLELAPALYGPTGMVAEQYKGLGLSGSSGTDWRASYDVFLGGLFLEEFEAPELVVQGEEVDDDESTEEIDLGNAAGGRLVLETPVSGLSFGTSIYSGREESSDSRQTTWGVQAEYLTGSWSLRSEYAASSLAEEKRQAFYAEGGRRLGPWQIAGRYDWFATADDDHSEDAINSSLLRHESLSAGLNYWFTPEFALKTSFTRVSGNRLAGPPLDELAEAFESGQLKATTNLFQFGAQFSF